MTNESPDRPRCLPVSRRWTLALGGTALAALALPRLATPALARGAPAPEVIAVHERFRSATGSFHVMARRPSLIVIDDGGLGLQFPMAVGRAAVAATGDVFVQIGARRSGVLPLEGFGGGAETGIAIEAAELDGLNQATGWYYLWPDHLEVIAHRASGKLGILYR